MSRAIGWQKVAIDGSVRSITRHSCSPNLLAAGLRVGDQPLLVDVTHGVARGFKGELPNRLHHGLSAVATDGANTFVTEDVDPSHAEPATMQLVDQYLTEVIDQPRDRRGSKPLWFWPLMDGEEDFRTVGAVRADGRWELHAWQDFGDWVPMDRGHPLFVSAKPSSRSVLTGSTEAYVIVAGAISDQSGGPDASPQVWTIEDIGGPRTSGRWTRRPLVPAPDALTDVASWEVGWWVAGHRDLRPVVYDFDSRDGAGIPMPATRLDPRHPVVYVAGIPISRSMVLATQSADGPTVWVRSGRNWLRIPAPAGKLLAAQTSDDGVYVLIDGTLWFRSMPDSGC